MARRRPAPTPDRPSRVVAYVRVSALKGREGDDFHSPDVQLGAIRRTIAGMREVAVVEDIDRTGRHFSREGIDRIRRLAEDRQIDAVALYDVSRLGRNVLESLIFLSWLADRGVTILSACEQVDTSTPSGRLMLHNMLSIAQYRSDEIGRGWSGTIARRAERGQHHGRPLGYTRQGKRMIPDPVMGSAMRDAFRRYAAGEPISDVASHVAAVRGRAVHTSNLKACLRSPVYLGRVVAGGEILPGQHDALVDEQTWERVQARLAREAGMPPRHLAPTWGLVGLCYCPHGHRLQRSPHRGRDGVVVDRLVCGMGRGQVVGQRCPGVGRPLLAPVEAEVLRQVTAYARRLRTDHTARAAAIARATAELADRGTLERELSRARTAQQRLAVDHALTPMSPEVYSASMAELRGREQAAAAELARLGPDAPPPPDPDETASAAEALLAMWPRMTHAERGQALRAVVDRVVVRPAATWREPEADRTEARFRW